MSITLVSKEQLENSIQALENRCNDYSDNCKGFEGQTDEDCYQAGFGTDLEYALRILKALREGKTVEVINPPPGRFH